MIIRYGVTCPGCDSKIVLRIGVGGDDAEHFFYVCAKCQTPTKCVQRLIYEPRPHTRLELEEGELVDAASASADWQTITIHPELPALPAASRMGDTGGSPFIYQFALAGHNFGELMIRMREFRSRIATN